MQIKQILSEVRIMMEPKRVEVYESLTFLPWEGLVSI
jgi:hypothetical protein